MILYLYGVLCGLIGGLTGYVVRATIALRRGEQQREKDRDEDPTVPW